MAAINKRRVWVGALAGGVVWNVWSILINMKVLGPHYKAAQEAGHLLAQPRYGFFLPGWILTLFALSYVVALMYASVRTTCGAGPKTAVSVGLMIGFAAGFPGNFANATWSSMSRVLPLWWMLDMWVGALLAALIAGWLYREQGT